MYRGSCIACISSRFADCAQGEYTLEHTDIHLQYKRETEQPCLFDQTHADTRNQTPWTSWSSHTRVEAVRKPDREPLTGSSSVAAERRWPFVGCACCAVLPTPRRAVPTRIAAAECTEMGLIMLPRSCLAAYNAQHECLTTMMRARPRSHCSFLLTVRVWASTVAICSHTRWLAGANSIYSVVPVLRYSDVPRPDSVRRS